MDKKSLRYLAGVSFGLQGIVNLYYSSSLSYGNSLRSDLVFWLIGVEVLAIAAILSKDILICVGGAIAEGCSIYDLVLWIQGVQESYYVIYDWSLVNKITVIKILCVLPWLLLCLYGVAKKYRKLFGLAAVVTFAGLVIFTSTVYQLSFVNWLLFALEFIGFLMFALIAFIPETKVQMANASSQNTKATGKGTQMERLSKLKSLLDKEIITQEEFDKKKNDIIAEKEM